MIPCGGACIPACTASDQCHDPGTCDPQTGQCSNPMKMDNTSCDDGNACTQSDACQNGACVSGSPLTCPPLDSCHDVGTCNTQTGQCGSYPILTGTCFIAGTCYAAGDVNPANQCQACDPAKSQTSFSNLADMTAYDDGDACTQTDACQSGVCVSGNPVTCPAATDQCHVAETCDPSSGRCSTANATRPNGTACSDGNPLCVNGACCTSGHEVVNGSCFTIGNDIRQCALSCQGAFEPVEGSGNYLCATAANDDCLNGSSCPAGQVCASGDVCIMPCG